MKLIGLDIGTTGCKAVLFEPDGMLSGKASREYNIEFPQPNWAEQDAEKVWRLAQEALAELLARAGRPAVAAVGLSVQGEAVMPVDGGGRALRHAILGMDTRTTTQNAELSERFGAQALFNRTGMPLHTINTLPKLLWLKQNEPQIWSAADRFLLYEDFIIQKMTGQAAISRCLASRTQLYDLAADGWSDELLAFLELEPEKLAPVRSSGFPVGEMTPSLAAELGFLKPPLIVTGGHDQACGALGVGLVQPGLAMVSTGTAEVVEVALASPVLNETLYHGNISVYAHVVSGLFLSMTLNHSGGLLLRWFRDTLCQEELGQAGALGLDSYDLILAGAGPQPSGLLVLPHFAGSGTPTFDTQSKGAIVGLTFAATKSDLAKAILEGLCYELRLNLDLLSKGGVGIEELRAIGGGARSAVWLQLKADITGIEVAQPRLTEAASWGAALLAGEGVGIFPSAARQAAASVILEGRYTPDPQRAARYNELYDQYSQLYVRLAPILHAL